MKLALSFVDLLDVYKGKVLSTIVCGPPFLKVVERTFNRFGLLHQ